MLTKRASKACIEKTIPSTSDIFGNIRSLGAPVFHVSHMNPINPYVMQYYYMYKYF